MMMMIMNMKKMHNTETKQFFLKGTLEVLHKFESNINMSCDCNVYYFNMEFLIELYQNDLL